MIFPQEFLEACVAGVLRGQGGRLSMLRVQQKWRERLPVLLVVLLLAALMHIVQVLGPPLRSILRLPAVCAQE